MIVMYIYLEFSQEGSVKEISDHIRLDKPQVCEMCDSSTKNEENGKPNEDNSQFVENKDSTCGICETVS